MEKEARLFIRYFNIWTLSDGEKEGKKEGENKAKEHKAKSDIEHGIIFGDIPKKERKMGKILAQMEGDKNNLKLDILEK